MKSKLRQALDKFEGGETAELIAALVEIGKKESDLLACAVSSDDEIRMELSERGEGIGRALELLDQHYCYKVCGQLRRKCPSLTSRDLADIWHVVLLAVVRRSRDLTRDASTPLLTSLWEISERVAMHTLRRRCGSVAEVEKLVQGTELGHMWQMLTDLQQEEVLALISSELRCSDRDQIALWKAYTQSLTESIATEARAVGTATQPREPAALNERRAKIHVKLIEKGYDFPGPDDDSTAGEVSESVQVGGAGPTVAFDCLVAEAVRILEAGLRTSFDEVMEADTYLTEDDFRALLTSGGDLPARIVDEQRSLPTSETALWSQRRANMETYLHATTRVHAGERAESTSEELTASYNAIIRRKYVSWAPEIQFIALLGVGGQGSVYLVRRHGDDGYDKLLALKLFDPRSYPSPVSYDEDARHMARMSRIISGIRHDNMVNVIDFRQERDIRMMLMEWIDGYDLGRLMVPTILDRTKAVLSEADWNFVNDVVIRPGTHQPRLRPGVAVFIIQHCLTALGEMHNRGIVHGDIKPWNIMLDRNGNTKLIDVGSSFHWRQTDQPYHYTYKYVAPEVQKGRPYTPQSDLASLGYVLVELLSGKSLFADLKSKEEILEAKESLPSRLLDVLPDRAAEQNDLKQLCQELIESDPRQRFPEARFAELAAQKFLDALTKTNYSVYWKVTIRDWLAKLG